MQQYILTMKYEHFDLFDEIKFESDGWTNALAYALAFCHYNEEALIQLKRID